jgi:hypothetical protein
VFETGKRLDLRMAIDISSPIKTDDQVGPSMGEVANKPSP